MGGDEDIYDTETRAKLLTEFYDNLLETTEAHNILPKMGGPY